MFIFTLLESFEHNDLPRPEIVSNPSDPFVNCADAQKLHSDSEMDENADC